MNHRLHHRIYNQSKYLRQWKKSRYHLPSSHLLPWTPTLKNRSRESTSLTTLTRYRKLFNKYQNISSANELLHINYQKAMTLSQQFSNENAYYPLPLPFISLTLWLQYPGFNN